MFNVLTAEERHDAAMTEANHQCMKMQLGMYLNLALIKLKSQRYKAAENDCIEALDIDPKNVKALFRRGVARIGLLMWAEAEADLKRARTLDPSIRNEVSAQLEVLSKMQKEQNNKVMEIIGGMFETEEFYDQSEVAPVRFSRLEIVSENVSIS